MLGKGGKDESDSENVPKWLELKRIVLTPKAELIGDRRRRLSGREENEEVLEVNLAKEVPNWPSSKAEFTIGLELVGGRRLSGYVMLEED